MMLPREKLQVGLGVLGLFLIGFGIAQVQPEARAEEPRVPQRSLGVGFWKDHSLAIEMGRRVGPWMIGCGMAAIGVAYVIRQR
jgi:hypothetical protein